MKFIPTHKLYGSGYEIADLARYLSRDLNLAKHGTLKYQACTTSFFVSNKSIATNIETISCECVALAFGKKHIISASSALSRLITDDQINLDSQFQLLELAINDKEIKEDLSHISQLHPTDLNQAFQEAQQYFLEPQQKDQKSPLETHP